MKPAAAFILSLILAAAAFAAPGPARADAARAAALLERAPIQFQANQGQLSSRVAYYARGQRHSLFLTPSGAVLSLHSKDGAGVVRMSFPGANPSPRIEGLEQLPSRTDYFLGNDPKRWRTAVPSYARVRYESIYPGVDLVYYGNGSELEYDFIVSPGADPSRIRLKFAGGDLRLDDEGRLIVKAGDREIVQSRPVVYQGSGAGRREVGGRYVLLAKSEAAFALGDYDRSMPLVIDPVLIYSSYFGGLSADVGNAVAMDDRGKLWVAGSAYSTDIPATEDNYKATNAGGRDIFLARFDPDAPPGTTFLYATYIGGLGDDEPRALRLGPGGKLYMVGSTGSSDFPIAGNAPQTTGGGNRDVFAMVFNPYFSGKDVLEFSTFQGGSENDYPMAFTLDAAGSFYIVGYTLSGNFPTTANSVLTIPRGGYDAFFVKISPAKPSAEAREYSSYFGGALTDVATGVALDSQGNVWFSGYTMSTDFPVTESPYQLLNAGNGDLFVTKFDLRIEGLNGLQYTTYIGGTGYDASYAMAIDAADRLYLTGVTTSTDFPPAGQAVKPNYSGGADAFLAIVDTKLPPTESLVYFTYLGGSGSDVPYALLLDPAGKAHIAGYTTSRDFPATVGAAQETFQGFADAFYMKVDPALPYAQGLVCATYYGGSLTEVANGIALDAAGNVYLTGYTQSRNLPVTENAFQKTLSGYTDAFVAKLSRCP